MSQALFVERAGMSAVRVHPIVVMSILEQYVRRDCDDERPDGQVIGTLLGTVSAGVVEITNCFGVPYHEKGDTIEINMLSAAKTLALHRQLNPSEQVVGWYSTCGEKTFIIDSTVAIQDFYMKETLRAVYLGIDVSFKTPHLPMKAFYCPYSPLLYKCRMQQFQELPASLVASDIERVGLTTIALAQKSRPHVLPTDTTTLLDSVTRLSELVQGAIAFVDDVLKGSVAADPAVGRALAAAIANVPRALGGRNDAYLKSLQNAIQDALMIMHVAKVAVTRVAVTDKIKSAASSR